MVIRVIEPLENGETLTPGIFALKRRQVSAASVWADRAPGAIKQLVHGPLHIVIRVVNRKGCREEIP